MPHLLLIHRIILLIHQGENITVPQQLQLIQHRLDPEEVVVGVIQISQPDQRGRQRRGNQRGIGLQPGHPTACCQLQAQDHRCNRAHDQPRHAQRTEEIPAAPFLVIHLRDFGVQQLHEEALLRRVFFFIAGHLAVKSNQLFLLFGLLLAVFGFVGHRLLEFIMNGLGVF